MVKGQIGFKRMEDNYNPDDCCPICSWPEMTKYKRPSNAVIVKCSRCLQRSLIKREKKELMPKRPEKRNLNEIRDDGGQNGKT